MNRQNRSSTDVEHHPARGALQAIGQAPARGLATGIAMVRLVQIARLARHDSTEAFEPVRPDECGPVRTADVARTELAPRGVSTGQIRPAA